MTYRILDPVANLGVVVSPTALVNAQCVSSRVLESFLKTEGLYDEREQAISPLPLHWCAPQNCVKYKVANLRSFWFVDHFAQLLVNHFTQAEQVYPVLGGFKVDKFPSWMASKSSETNPLGPLKVPIRHANHTVLVVGIYIKSHNPLVIHIKFKNTWGKHWGIGGYCWVTTSLFDVLSFPNMDFDAIITRKSFRLEEKKASATRFSSSQPNSKKAVLAKGSKLEPIMSVQDINIQSQALLNVRDSNKDERERIVVRRFKFEELRLEQIQDLENELMKYFREDLHKRLLNTDFKKQVDGIEMLQRALPSIAKDLIEVLDILLKWFVLLFCESNTSCLLKVLEFLPKLCETLRNEKYTMNESEASIFFPCLVEKTGHKIEKLREKIRELMKQIIHSYSAAKTFPYILEGLRSRNNRTRIECADLVGFLLDNNGSEISGRLKSLQIVASLTAERDGELRKAALNCLATGYKMFGDDLWRYVGKLTEAQRSMIDARFKWKAREMEKRKERKPGEARAALRRPVRENGSEQSGEVLRSISGSVFTRGIYTPPEPQMERHPMARPTGGIIGPTDWNEALDVIIYGSPEQSVEGMKVVCHELAAAANDPEGSLMDDLIKDADRLVSCLAAKVAKTFDFRLMGASSRSCKHVLNTLMQTFQNKRLADAVNQRTLDSLITELLLCLLNERVPSMDDGSQIIKALNILMLKILVNYYCPLLHQTSYLLQEI